MTSESEPEPVEVEPPGVSVEVEVPPTPVVEESAPVVVVEPTPAPTDDISSVLVSELIATREALAAQNARIETAESTAIEAGANAAIARETANSASQEIADIADDVEDIKEGEQAPAVEDIAPERKHWFFG